MGVEKPVPKKVITFVQKKVEAPRVVGEERAVEAEQRFQVELNTTREVPVVQKRQVNVPKTVVQTSERVIDVPSVLVEDTLVEVPQVQVVEATNIVPRANVQVVEKTVPRTEVQVV